MKKWHAVAAAVLFGTPLALPAHAQDAEPKDDETPIIRIGLNAVTVWQAMTLERGGIASPELEPGFQAALGNLHLYVTPVEGISVYAELYLSSKHHPGYVMDREGYLFIDRLPEAWLGGRLAGVFDHIDVKAGHFEVDYGNLRYFRSDGAQVQTNPLIGNYVIDPNTVEGGAELIGTVGPVRAVAGFGTGLTTEDFQAGTGYSLHGKLALQPTASIYEAPYAASVSVYRSDQSGTPTGYPKTGTSSELFSGNRSGERYGGPFLTPRPGVDPDFGQIKPGAGQDVLGWQVDGLARLGPVFALAAYGWTKDADANGYEPELAVQTRPEDEWSYYSAEARIDVLPSVYLASRYSGARAASVMGTATDGRVGRFQVGVGHRLIDEILMKLEFVTQRYSGFGAGGAFGDDLRFSGFLAEGSFSF